MNKIFELPAEQSRDAIEALKTGRRQLKVMAKTNYEPYRGRFVSIASRRSGDEDRVLSFSTFEESLAAAKSPEYRGWIVSLPQYIPLHGEPEILISC